MEHTKQATWYLLLTAWRTKSSGHRPLLQPEHFVPKSLGCSVHYLESIPKKYFGGDCSLLEEITPAVQLALPRVALLTEYALTFTALHTLHVPRLVQNLHQVALHDGLLATPTHKWSHHLAQGNNMRQTLAGLSPFSSLQVLVHENHNVT